jgi:hypothetical protein
MHIFKNIMLKCKQNLILNENVIDTGTCTKADHKFITASRK